MATETDLADGACGVATLGQRRRAKPGLCRQGLDFDSILALQRASLLIRSASARAARYADTAALFHALSDGWWTRGELAAAGTPVAFEPAPAGAGAAK